MISVKFLLWVGCIIQLSHFALSASTENSSSQESNSVSATPSQDLASANSDEEDVVYIKNCSEAKTISKRETDRLSQPDDGKDDISNHGTGDTRAEANSPMNLHEIPLTFSEKDEANTNENGDMVNTTVLDSNEVPSFEEGSSTENPEEEDIIVLPLPPRPIFIELIFFKTNRSSSPTNGTSIGNFKNRDSSVEDLSDPSSMHGSNENGSNLTRSGPPGLGLSDMKESSEGDETTGLEHVRLSNSKTPSTTTTMQTTSSLDDGNNEEVGSRSTRNSDNFNSAESSSAISAKTMELSSPPRLAPRITRLPANATSSHSDIVGQGLSHRSRSINSDEDAADTNSGPGTHMSVTISGSELQGKSNRRESKSSTTASPVSGNRRRRDTIFSHLTNNSQTGSSSEDGKHSSEKKKLMVATSTTIQDTNNSPTDSNLPDVSDGESLEVIVSGSRPGPDTFSSNRTITTTNTTRTNGTTSHNHPEGNKGIIAAFMEILGIGGSGMEDNNKATTESSNANITNTAAISPSNSNQNSTRSISSGQQRRVSRAANGPTGNSNPSSSPSPPSSTPNSISSTSKPDGKSNAGAGGSDEHKSGLVYIPLLNVPSAGTNSTKFKTPSSN